MDFTATVKRRRFGCSASDRSPYEMPPEALLQSARSSRSEAGAKALDPGGTGLGHSATRRRVKATGVVCRVGGLRAPRSGAAREPPARAGERESFQRI